MNTPHNTPNMETTPPEGRWRNSIVAYGAVDPQTLLPNPRNWRTHTKAQRRALDGALSTVGWIVPVIVNRTTGHLVDGHARVEEAIALQATEVPVAYVDLTPEEEVVALATLDPITSLAEADTDQVTTLLAMLDPANEALQQVLARVALEAGAAYAGMVDAPAAGKPFQAFDETIHVDYRCPQCHYEWSGGKG